MPSPRKRVSRRVSRWTCSTTSSCSSRRESAAAGDSASSGSSSPGSSSGTGSVGSEDESDGNDDDGDLKRKRIWRKKTSDGQGPVQAPQGVRRRSLSRRGARKRGGSVLCRFCGRRGYGVMSMVFSCCSSKEPQDGGRITAGAHGSRPRVFSLSLPRPAPLEDARLVSPAEPSSPRYNWSPCSSSSSSSSTLSDSAANSSGEDADAEAKVPSQPAMRLLRYGGHEAKVS